MKEREREVQAVRTSNISLCLFLGTEGSCELIRAKRTATLQRSLGFHTPPLSAATSLLSLPLFPPSDPSASLCVQLYFRGKRSETSNCN